MLEIVSLIDWVLLKVSPKGWQHQDWSGKYVYRKVDGQELFHEGAINSDFPGSAGVPDLLYHIQHHMLLYHLFIIRTCLLRMEWSNMLLKLLAPANYKTQT